jgi:hypothetical protein
MWLVAPVSAIHRSSYSNIRIVVSAVDAMHVSALKLLDFFFLLRHCTLECFIFLFDFNVVIAVVIALIVVFVIAVLVVETFFILAEVYKICLFKSYCILLLRNVQ